MQDWKQQRGLFAAVGLAPTLWLLLFFIVPLGIMWAFSFGSNEGLTTIRFTGTFANYVRAVEPLHLEIFGKSVAVAALTTGICLFVGFPIAMAISFLDEPVDPDLRAPFPSGHSGCCKPVARMVLGEGERADSVCRIRAVGGL
jgi:spermidine/putrescine transport system permease protein